jgi:hypothetical protein
MSSFGDQTQQLGPESVALWPGKKKARLRISRLGWACLLGAVFWYFDGKYLLMQILNALPFVSYIE